MATFIALIFSVLAVAMASTDLHRLATNPSLDPFQDPSKFIWNTSPVYLSRVSVYNTSAFLNGSKPWCVLSRYWSNTTNNVERSLDIYSTNNRSMNISLSVQKEHTEQAQHYILRVNVSESTPSLGDIFDMGYNYTQLHSDLSFNYSLHTLAVLYSDAHCLILYRKLKTGSIGRPWLQCSMWLTEQKIRKPPKCCQFVFALMCTPLVETVEVFDDSCLPKESKSKRKP
uniref:Lipocalin n=1 Tax=Rhipicephalus appendiculatus TaxID=34631 RepID=A0A131YWF4_RHIAP